MTVIEIRPYRNGWKVFEAPGVEPVFLTKDQAMSYAQKIERVFAREKFGWSIQPAMSNG